MRVLAAGGQGKECCSRLHRDAVLIIFSGLLFLSCFRDFGCRAQQLAQEEVKSLKLIASKLRKEWDFLVDPCSGNAGWVELTSSYEIANNVTCNCNVTSNVCHVTSILLKGQNLTGVLPEEFANLTYLSVLDLTHNYLSGSIPATWASLPLTQLSLLGNRISGSIPKELGSIISLQSLVLENNQLQGSIPVTLGNLINLNRSLVSANNLSGELPDSLGNLKNLIDFRIDGNPISGKIPSFFGNWTKLLRLDLQGTSMEGPFPPTFSALESLTQLRVSDLKGGDGKFPPLQNMKIMERLVLRNLSISGKLPEFIGEMTNLKTLDLSFNNLTGPIPSNFDGLMNSINYMYLTNNMLNGAIPNWILSSRQNLDISYNSFSGSLSPSACQEGNLNMVSSYSSTESNSIVPCLKRNLPCPVKCTNYNLFINCGGRKVIIDDDEYEDDPSQLGPSRFAVAYSKKWAYSSTGDFVGNDRARYVATNVSVLNMTGPELYMTARLSPLSLRYYGLCLQKGNYTVNLHFTEIMFTDDQTYFSVGKRIFDVSIQGQKVLQDFNIVKEANGTGRPIIKSFNATVDGTLEIHFRWAGKGTNTIPESGVYGPLISAISVTPNFKPDIHEFKPDIQESKLSIGAIFGVLAASCVTIGLILIMLWLFIRRKNSEKDGQIIKAHFG